MRPPRIGIFIQARANSSRLPGKIFATLDPRDPQSSVLGTIYRRLSCMSGAHTVILVPENDPTLIDWCRSQGFEYFAGPEDDVRLRYRQAARRYDVDVIVRATGDNPCVDPDVTIDTVRELLASDADLLSFGNLPLGVAVEAMRRDALFSDLIEAEDMHREHVSLHIKHNPELYRVLHPDHALAPARGTQSMPRLTVDTAEDLEVVRAVFTKLGPRFRTGQILNLYRAAPELFAANQDIQQRTFACRTLEPVRRSS